MAGAQVPGATPALSFDVTEADFEVDVLERSLQVPVLLDCWAPWCGPCRSLGPVLEKLATAYGGRFLLAKLNTDEAPQISAALRIRSIPLVVLFVGGRPVDQFLGALPEGQVRQFLDKHLPPGDADADADGEPEPEFGPLDEAAMLIEEGALDEAQAILDATPADQRIEQYTRLVARLKLARETPEGDPDALAARVAANPRDFEARFGLAALLAHGGNFAAAFEQLLEVVLRDKAEGKPDRELARKQLIEWFEVCPDPEVVSQGRRYLGMYLN
jgi:putative thioredoxin